MSFIAISSPATPTATSIFPQYDGTPLPLGTMTPLDINNAATVQMLSRLGKGKIIDIALHPEGEIIAVAAPTGIYLYDSATLEERPYVDTGDIVRVLEFSPNGKTIASASADETARLWNVQDGEIQQTLGGHNGRVNDIAFSFDGALMATASSDRITRLWQVEKGR